MRLLNSSIGKDFVKTCIPGSRCPFPITAFSAYPVTNKIFKSGCLARAASATCRPFIPGGCETDCEARRSVAGAPATAVSQRTAEFPGKRQLVSLRLLSQRERGRTISDSSKIGEPAKVGHGSQCQNQRFRARFIPKHCRLAPRGNCSLRHNHKRGKGLGIAPIARRYAIDFKIIYIGIWGTERLPNV